MHSVNLRNFLSAFTDFIDLTTLYFQDSAFIFLEGGTGVILHTNMSKYDSKSFISLPELSHQSTISIDCLDIQ